MKTILLGIIAFFLSVVAVYTINKLFLSYKTGVIELRDFEPIEKESDPMAFYLLFAVYTILCAFIIFLVLSYLKKVFF